MLATRPRVVRCLNLRLTTLATDVRAATVAYTQDMVSSDDLRSRCEGVYPGKLLQKVRLH
jgi:hypothetical protein